MAKIENGLKGTIVEVSEVEQIGEKKPTNCTLF